MTTIKSLYFIRSGKEGPIKIGIGYDPSKRLVECQVGNPEELRLLGSKDIAGNAKIIEGEIHKKFKHLHIRGEWFTPAQELLDFIAGIEDLILYHEDIYKNLPVYPCNQCGKLIPYPFIMGKIYFCGECFVTCFNS